MNRRYPWGREVEVKPMRTRVRAGNHASDGRSRGQAAVCGRDGTDRWGLPVSVSQRGEEAEPDERDPLVNDRAERGQHAQRPRGPSARAGLGRSQAGRPRDQCVFLFLFCLKMLNV